MTPWPRPEFSPLTGRDQEVGLLKDRWEQAREGMGQIVLLIGEPGLGKSRLVHTMKQHVLGQMIEGEVDAPVIEWRCSPHFQNTGLYPAIDFYERALGFGREERAAGPVRPDAAPPGTVRSGPARDRPAVGVAAVAPDSRIATRRCRCRRSGSVKKHFGPCWTGCTRAPRGSRSCSSSRTCTGWTPPLWSSWDSSSRRACTTPS